MTGCPDFEKRTVPLQKKNGEPYCSNDLKKIIPPTLKEYGCENCWMYLILTKEELGYLRDVRK